VSSSSIQDQASRIVPKIQSMKKKSISQLRQHVASTLRISVSALSPSRRLYQAGGFNLRVLIGLFVFLGGVFLALFATANPSKSGGRGFGAFSIASAEGEGSSKAAASTADIRPSQTNLAFTYDATRHLDEHGHRPSGIRLARAGAGKGRRAAIAGPGAWFSLGPPGGDVFDAAASTGDPDIVLAGVAPGGSFGGTLYRSSDGGQHMVRGLGYGRHQRLRHRVRSRR
jgi:hypothetical protein